MRLHGLVSLALLLTSSVVLGQETLPQPLPQGLPARQFDPELSKQPLPIGPATRLKSPAGVESSTLESELEALRADLESFHALSDEVTRNTRNAETEAERALHRQRQELLDILTKVATQGISQKATTKKSETKPASVSETVASALLEDREGKGRMTDTLAVATLMFTDIEGFTGLSERLPPDEVARLLNGYLGIVVPIIQRHGGVVNNFIGDGLFASFNLPLSLDNHAAAALRASLEIQHALSRQPQLADGRLRTRIGINTGPVIGVSVGTEKRMSYTLLGDAVNIASRIEQLNKSFGT